MLNDEGRQAQDTGNIVSRLRSLAITDQIFYGLVFLSFAVLVVLAFLGKSTEMGVLGGFTAIALAFLKLERFSEFSALGFSGKLRDVIEKFNAIADHQTEVDPGESGEDFGKPTAFSVTAQEIKVLEAIYRSKFTFRSVGGIAQQLKVSNENASRLLNTLAQKGFVSHSVTSKRRSIWNITEEGITTLQRNSNHVGKHSE
jgi:DNA-binding MarR family transcriptional regulator